MNKFISFFKKYKKKVIIISIILIVLAIFIFVSYQLFKYLTPDTKNSVYGDRCELTEDIKITNDREKMIKETIEATEGMTLSDVDVKCNLIDVVVIVKDDVEVKKVKETANEMLLVFTEEELKYYDIQLWVDSEDEESKTYPIIGTRHKTSNGDASGKFVW